MNYQEAIRWLANKVCAVKKLISDMKALAATDFERDAAEILCAKARNTLPPMVYAIAALFDKDAETVEEDVMKLVQEKHESLEKAGKRYVKE